MNSSRSSSLILLPVCAGLAGIAFGWCARDLSSPIVPPLEPVSASARADSSATGALAEIGSPAASPATRLQVSIDDPGSVSTEEVIDRVLLADSKNMVNLVEAIGGLTRLTNAQVKEGWKALSERVPRPGMGGPAAVIYLWSRMARMGTEVPLLKGWGAENFAATIALARNQEKPSDLRQKLEAGGTLDDVQRRVVFRDALRADPLGAVMLWMKHTKPWDFQADAALFGNALSDAATRDAIMTRAREWQTDKDLMGTLVATLARDWIARDPAAVEQWVNLPGQADVRGRIMEQVVNTRALSNPADTWQWSKALPEKERHQALGMSAAQLANNQPANGAQLIAGLQDPAERTVAVREFGRVLAASNIVQWKQWRDSLPEHERAITNTSAFQMWVFNEPENAVAWLNQQPDGRAKDTMIDTLVDVYAERDPQVAAQWIQTIPDPERRRGAAISALAAIGPERIEAVQTILAALPKQTAH